MSSLSDKLRAHGVQKGSQNLKPQKAKRSRSIERHIPGEIWNTLEGDAYVIEERYPATHRLGKIPLWVEPSLKVLASWAQEPGVAEMTSENFAFLDTETTGLSGGTGTFAFMVGIGRFVDSEFQLAQFFLREPGEEPAQLAAIEKFLAPCTALVTFNGKSFDIPILRTRYTLHRWPTPFETFAHIDLLHLARRLWRDRLPSRRLGDLEIEILGNERGEQEVPGWMVPEIYLEYLRTGDAEPLKGVFYHNAMDILSLAGLLHHMATLLSEPIATTTHDRDLLAIAKLHDDLGQIDKAQALYIECLSRPLEQDAWLEAARRSALIYKRAKKWEPAIRLWEVAARRREIEAHVELAKYFEHHAHQIEAAHAWTVKALAIVSEEGYPFIERFQWESELRHRLERLERKRARD